MMASQLPPRRCALSSWSTCWNGSSSGSMNRRPIRLMTPTFLPLDVAKMPVPLPGVPAGKLNGRSRRASPPIWPTVSFWSQTWLPVVMQSTPAAYRSSQIFLVMPKPTAAFSPFATTKSMAWSRRRPGRRSTTTSRPALPTMSPQNSNRMALSHLVHGGDHLDRDACKVIGGFLGHDPIQRLVKIIARHAHDMLRGKGDAHRERIGRAPAPQLVERPVVEAAAVAEAEALRVERQERHDQHPRLDLRRA